MGGALQIPGETAGKVPTEQPCWDHSKWRDGMGAAGSEEEEEEGEEEA